MKALVCIISSLFILTIAKTALAECGCNHSKKSENAASNSCPHHENSKSKSCGESCTCTKNDKSHSCSDSKDSCGCHSEKKANT